MNINDKKIIKLEELKNIQNNFEESIKNLEKNIAESITKKNKLEEIKKDLIEANEKFNDAEKCLDDLKIQINSNKHTSNIDD